MLQFGEDICWICCLAILCNLVYQSRLPSFFLLPLPMVCPFHLLLSLSPFPSLTVWKPGTACRETEAVRSSGFRTPPPSPRRQGPGARLAGTSSGAPQGAAGKWGGVQVSGVGLCFPLGCPRPRIGRHWPQQAPDPMEGSGVPCHPWGTAWLGKGWHSASPLLPRARLETFSCVWCETVGPSSKAPSHPSLWSQKIHFLTIKASISLWGTVAYSGPCHFHVM